MTCRRETFSRRLWSAAACCRFSIASRSRGTARQIGGKASFAVQSGSKLPHSKNHIAAKKFRGYNSAVKLRFSLLVTFCLASVVLADWFFYGHPFGWTVGVYELALVVAIWARGGRLLRSRGGVAITAAMAGLAWTAIEQPRPLAFAVGIVGIVTLAIVAREGWEVNAFTWVQRWGMFLLMGWWQFIRDVALRSRWLREHPQSKLGSSRLWRVVRNWIVPVVLSCVFIILFAVANPIISKWLDSFGDWLRRLFSELPDFPRMSRVFLWVLVGIWTWALLRVRTGTRDAKDVALPPRYGEGEAFPSAAAIVRCLVLFNAVFAVQTLLDLRYLWGGAALPEDMSHSEYAHRGAYPLIATALLAAGFVLVTFREGPSAVAMLWARRLVVGWIAQNVFLVASAAWRLWLYVDAFSLTRWRLAAAIWMALVAMGLVWIGWRIVAGRSNRWLVNVNALTATVVLYLCCFVDFNGFIARYNVRHCREATGEGAPIDLAYLRDLGPEALPALTWLMPKIKAEGDVLRAQTAAKELREELDAQLADWRGWTLQRERLTRK